MRWHEKVIKLSTHQNYNLFIEWQWLKLQRHSYNGCGNTKLFSILLVPYSLQFNCFSVICYQYFRFNCYLIIIKSTKYPNSLNVQTDRIQKIEWKHYNNISTTCDLFKVWRKIIYTVAITSDTEKFIRANNVLIRIASNLHAMYKHTAGLTS